MRHEHDIELPSGTVLKTNGGIIGIDHHGTVFQGYDGKIFDPEWEPEWQDNIPTSADMAALADIMIERWQKFKNQHSTTQAAK